ncbi:T9SS type A sorting domain-containing protein [Chryseobacterium sp. JUb7]|uniref:T9SS type A sorting domain-containing protein n=1 Tax=Chryseobacterium sp. JUb7 TaxID=2940599 RepID=UPI002169ABD8|nr:T9SS type A sorting domain-containing protein [Chryseobacterium sp. JUb7]MCS3529159.1 hypothetical protein [Chryseobacterium sp. JUb7]
MKKISILFGLAVGVSMGAQYCTPVFQYTADSNMITNVTFGSINNTSPFQSGTTPVYENFLSMSTNIQAGTDYPVSVKGPSGTFPSDIVVFIDFNQNGNFNDAGESFYIGRLTAANPVNAFTVTGTISVPAGATAGPTRMRVLKNNNTAAFSDPNAPNSIITACDTGLRAGQTEDYTVNVQPSSLSTREVYKENLKIHPNPAKDIVYIKTLDKIEKYEVFTTSGQKITEGNTDSINTNDFAPGSYIIKITTKDQKILTEKILKL